MVNILVNSAAERRTWGPGDGGWYYDLQYDLPGIAIPDALTTGRHHHIIPITALADHLMTTGTTSMEGAVEYCMLDRLSDIYTDAGIIKLPQLRLATAAQATSDIPLGDASNAPLEEARAHLREAVEEVARTKRFDRGWSLEERMRSVFEEVRPVSGNARTARAATGEAQAAQAEARTLASDFTKQLIDLDPGITVSKTARGWGTLRTIAMNAGSKMETAQWGVFKARFGDGLRATLGYEQAWEGREEAREEEEEQ